ncbi:MAG TPA: ABC transporter permease [Mycobacteriales bacterium]|nr:ABC transporter permease [Mycobacteriales bacterium]HWC34250.1 ABC transporter permease [Mycobacteriales bacterium]
MARPDEGFELRGPSTPPRVMLRELWAARRLLVILARKDFYVRYRRTVLGVVWAVGVPLVQAVVLAIVFTHVVGIGRSFASSQREYAVFLYSALVPWNYIANAGPAASTAIVDNVALAGKIYFPRALPVLVTAASAVYPFSIGIVLLLVMSLVVGSGIGVSFLLVIPGAALTVLFVVSVGLCLSALHVYFRDIRYIVMAVLSVGFYLTPIIYPLGKLQHSHHVLRDLLAIGPGSGPIEIFRAATVGSDSALGLAVAACAGWCVVLGSVGFWLQCRRDRVFVDLL